MELANKKATTLTYGAKIRLMHVNTGSWLGSGLRNYPAGSGQQFVACFEEATPTISTLWIVKPEHAFYGKQLSGEVPAKAIIRLEHVQTKRNLHSHNVRCCKAIHSSTVKVSSVDQLEVSCFGTNGNGDANCNWRVFYDQDSSGSLRLQHVVMGDKHG